MPQDHRLFHEDEHGEAGGELRVKQRIITVRLPPPVLLRQFRGAEVEDLVAVESISQPVYHTAISPDAFLLDPLTNLVGWAVAPARALINNATPPSIRSLLFFVALPRCEM